MSQPIFFVMEKVEKGGVSMWATRRWHSGLNGVRLEDLTADDFLVAGYKVACERCCVRPGEGYVGNNTWVCSLHVGNGEKLKLPTVDMPGQRAHN